MRVRTRVSVSYINALSGLTIFSGLALLRRLGPTYLALVLTVEIILFLEWVCRKCCLMKRNGCWLYSDIEDDCSWHCKGTLTNMVVLFLTPTHLLIQCVDNSKRSSSNITGAITNARTAHFLCGIAIITTRNGVYQREGVWDICSRAGRSDCWDICKWSIVEQSCRTSNEGNSGQKALLLPTNTNSNLHYSNVKLALFIPPKHQPAIAFFFL